MLHQVLRKFKADGKDLKAGQIVETSGWKNERLLLEHRFLGKPSVPQKDAATVVEGAHVEAAETAESAGAISKPESPKATPMKSGKPAVLGKRVPVVGKVPAAKVATQVKTNG
jgi:hypothetical protein